MYDWSKAQLSRNQPKQIKIVFFDAHKKAPSKSKKKRGQGARAEKKKKKGWEQGITG